MSEIIIKNVTDFFNAIREIKTNDKSELFFRGHADHEYVAEPTIFRKNKQGERNHLKNEKHLFNDIVTQCPEEFKDCQYTFEYLVKMQHYGLPTRLLDITSNALVALYFACCSLNSENNYKDGKVLVYVVRKDAIKNYNSDTVSVLSNLAQLDNDFKLEDPSDIFMGESIQKYSEELDFFTNQILQAIKKSLQKEVAKKCIKRFLELEKSKNFLSSSLRDNTSQANITTYEISDLIELIEKLESDYEKVIQKIEAFNVSNEKNKQADLEDELVPISFSISSGRDIINFFQNKKGRFLHFIKQEKSYFVDKMDSAADVQKIVCVKAKLNNPRIIRQNGLFFLFGMGDTKGQPIALSNSNDAADVYVDIISSTIEEITNPTIIISAEKKADIIEELRTLGISKETLMPEIDVVASTLKDRYN